MLLNIKYDFKKSTVLIKMENFNFDISSSINITCYGLNFIMFFINLYCGLGKLDSVWLLIRKLFWELHIRSCDSEARCWCWYSRECFLSGTMCYYYVGSRWGIIIITSVKSQKCKVNVMVPASHSRTQQAEGGEFSATLVS